MLSTIQKVDISKLTYVFGGKKVQNINFIVVPLEKNIEQTGIK